MKAFFYANRQAEREYRAPPEAVQDAFGYRLERAQAGEFPATGAKPLKGFGGTDMVELWEDDAGDTYRSVYTVRFADAVIVLCAWQKKSRHGAATEREVRELIATRLQRAQAGYEAWRRGREGADA